MLLCRKKGREREMETTIEESTAAFPAKAQLSAALTKYLQVNTEVSAFESKLAKRERDEAEAFDAVGLSEEKQVSRLAEVRIKKDVQSRRTSHKRLELTRMLGELEEAYPAAETEVSAAQAIEFTRRQELLTAQITGILGLSADDWEAAGFLFRAVGGSPLLTAIRALAPNPNAHMVSIEQRASQLLEVA